MTEITNSMKERAPRFGVELVDVRIGRTDLPEQTSNSVYSRMRSAREAEAKQLRAEGQEQKDTIEAEANRRRTVLLAKAKETSLKLRGEGDASKISILAAAHNRDPKFYSFLKSLEAYKASLKEGTTLVLKPDSEFFKYLKQIPKP
jgi:membrane protease subunit HflC